MDENYAYSSWQSINNRKKWWSAFIQCACAAYFHFHTFITFYDYLLIVKGDKYFKEILSFCFIQIVFI